LCEERIRGGGGEAHDLECPGLDERDNSVCGVEAVASYTLMDRKLQPQMEDSGEDQGQWTKVVNRKRNKTKSNR
jgi:hypothetical protein